MPEDVKAQITGTVWKIVVKTGDEVDDGDDLIILESMKMEIPVESPVDGTVVELLVAEGDSVDEDQVLCRIEED
jgi:acetyl-CoA carboxylase biotin carboxyl carrier protein